MRGDGTYSMSVRVGLDGVSSVKSMNVVAIPSPLVASISGGTKRMAAPSTTDLTLDASPSYDPDTCPPPDPTSTGAPCVDAAMMYAWACQTEPDGLECRTKTDSAVASFPAQAVARVNIEALSLSESHSGVLMTVTTSKGSRTASHSVSVAVVNGGDPNLKVELMVETRDTVAFQHTGATSGPDSGLTWSLGGAGYLGEEGVLPSGSYVPTGWLGNEVVLDMGSESLQRMFAPGGTYTVTLHVDGTAGPSLSLKAPSRPLGGTCVTTPQVAREFLDTVTCLCEGWTAEELPMSYSVRVEGGEWSSPSFRNDMRVWLLEGSFEVAGKVTDAAGSDTEAPSQGVTVVAGSAPSIAVGQNSSNGTAAAPSQDAVGLLDSALSDMEDSKNAAGLISVSATVMRCLDTEEAAGSAGNTSSASRRLLASSAAYRMRVRRLLLRKLTGVSSTLNSTARLAASGLGSVQALTTQPSELDTNAADHVANVLASLVSTVRGLVARQGVGKVIQAVSAMIAMSKAKLGRVQGNRVVLGVIRSCQKVAMVFAGMIMPAHGVRCLSSEGIKVSFRRMTLEESTVQLGSSACVDQAANTSSPVLVRVTRSDTGSVFGEGMVTLVLDDIIWERPQTTRRQEGSASRVFSDATVGVFFDDPRSKACSKAGRGSECIVSRLRLPMTGLNAVQVREAVAGSGVKCWQWGLDAFAWNADVCSVNATTNASTMVGGSDTAPETAQSVSVVCACNAPGYFIASYDPPLLRATTADVHLFAPVGSHDAMRNAVMVIVTAVFGLLIVCLVSGSYVVGRFWQRFARNASLLGPFLWTEKFEGVLSGNLDGFANSHEPDTEAYYKAVARQRQEKSVTPRRFEGEKPELHLLHHRPADREVDGKPEEARVNGVGTDAPFRRMSEGGLRRRRTSQDMTKGTSQDLIDVSQPATDAREAWARQRRNSQELANFGGWAGDIEMAGDGDELVRKKMQSVSRVRCFWSSFPDEDGLFWKQDLGVAESRLDGCGMADDWQHWMPRMVLPGPTANQYTLDKHALPARIHTRNGGVLGGWDGSQQNSDGLEISSNCSSHCFEVETVPDVVKVRPFPYSLPPTPNAASKNVKVSGGVVPAKPALVKVGDGAEPATSLRDSNSEVSVDMVIATADVSKENAHEGLSFEGGIACHVLSKEFYGERVVSDTPVASARSGLSVRDSSPRTLPPRLGRSVGDFSPHTLKTVELPPRIFTAKGGAGGVAREKGGATSKTLSRVASTLRGAPQGSFDEPVSPEVPSPPVLSNHAYFMLSRPPPEVPTAPSADDIALLGFPGLPDPTDRRERP